MGSGIFYYFIRKIQNINSIDPSSDPFGLMGAAYYGIILGFIFGIKFIDLKKIIKFFKKRDGKPWKFLLLLDIIILRPHSMLL